MAVAAVLAIVAALPALAQDMGPYDGTGPDGMGPDSPDGIGPDGMGPAGGGRGGMGGRGMRDETGGRGDGGAPADLSEYEVTVHGRARPYYAHIPRTIAHPAPVVFLFHGGGGRPQAIARRSDLDALADQNGFVAIYPQGSDSPSGRGGTWNIASAQSVSSADDVGYVKAILADIGARVQIDPARIYAAGHSMGGIFSYRLACEMSDTFAAISPVSATMVEPSCRPTSPVAVLHIHGSADERIPLRGGRGQETAGGRDWPAPQKGVTVWSKFDACAATPTRKTEGIAECETYEGCQATVEMCVLPGEGHPWPSDAAPKIWAFFSAHPKVSR